MFSILCSFFSFLHRDFEFAFCSSSTIPLWSQNGETRKVKMKRDWQTSERSLLEHATAFTFYYWIHLLLFSHLKCSNEWLTQKHTWTDEFFLLSSSSSFVSVFAWLFIYAFVFFSIWSDVSDGDKSIDSFALLKKEKRKKRRKTRQKRMNKKTVLHKYIRSPLLLTTIVTFLLFLCLIFYSLLHSIHPSIRFAFAVRRILHLAQYDHSSANRRNDIFSLSFYFSLELSCFSFTYFYSLV